MDGTFRVERQDEKGKTHLSIRGIIDEDSNFTEAFAGLERQVVLNLAGVKLINSLGIREWVQALQTIPKDREIFFEECSIRIIEQANIVADFLRLGRVLSFYAPYFCPKCKNSTNVLLEPRDVLKTGPQKAPTRNCPNCGIAMEFDDVEEEYFSFLEPQSPNK